MASKTDLYIGEAYKQLEIMSQDREKRIAYTSRQKAIMDYNTIMAERYDKGIQEGIQRGIQQGRQELVIKWKSMGMSDAEIEKLLN